MTLPHSTAKLSLTYCLILFGYASTKSMGRIATTTIQLKSICSITQRWTLLMYVMKHVLIYQKVSFQKAHVHHVGDESTLTIFNVSLDDQGIYACLSGNSLGMVRN